MKKFLSLILSLTLFSALLPLGVLAVDETTTAAEYISVPVNIADNLYTRKVYTNYGGTAKVAWNLLSYGAEANIYLDGFKNKQQDTSVYGLVNYDWKNAWGENDKRNTLIMNSTGVEYNMYLESSQTGGGAVDASGNAGALAFDVDKGYYDKISMLLSGITGIGYNSATTDKGIQVVLTYADGTEELKSTGGLYNGWYNGVERDDKLKNSFLRLNAISVASSVNASGYEKEVTFGTSLKSSPYFISAYDIETDENKILEKVTVVSGNTKATIGDNKKCTFSSENGANSGANLFSITALTTKELQNKTYIEAVESAVTALGDVSELTYSSENATKINTLNTELQACTTNNITLSSSLQSTVNAILSAWANLLPISVPVDISNSGLSCIEIFANYGDSKTGWWDSYLSYLGSNKYIMSLKSFKDGTNSTQYGHFTWKNQWQKDANGNYLDSDTTNTAILDGIEYTMTVKTASQGGSAYEFNNNAEGKYTVKEGYYSDISLLMHSALGKEYYTDDRKTNLTIQLNYVDGSNEKVETAPIHNSKYSGTGSYMKVDTLLSTKINNVCTFGNEVSGVHAFIKPYSVPVNQNKKLTGFTILKEGGSANIFAITALTNESLKEKAEDEKLVSVPVEIDSSLYKRKVYANFNESADIVYNIFGANRNTNVHLDSFKNVSQTMYGKNNYSWKNTWETDTKRNTLILNDNGLEYNMHVESSVTGGGAVDASGNAGVLSFDVNDNYYEKLSFLLSGITGIGYNGATTDKGIQVVLTYADGTEELKSTGGLYYTYNNAVEKLGEPYLSLNTVSGTVTNAANTDTLEKTLLFGNEVEDWTYAYIKPYEVDVNEDKLLEKVSVIAGNTKATLGTNGKCTYSFEASANSGANLFAVTAVTSKGTMKKDKTTELTSLVASIDVDSLTYTSENAAKVSCVNKLYKSLTDSNVAINSDLTTKVNKINIKWQTLTAGYQIVAGDATSQVYVSGNYHYLGVKVPFINSMVTAGVSGDVFVALYDKTTNKLISVKQIVAQNFAYGSEVIIEKSFGLEAYDEQNPTIDTSNLSVKVFVWDSLAGMKPYAKVVTVK